MNKRKGKYSPRPEAKIYNEPEVGQGSTIDEQKNYSTLMKIKRMYARNTSANRREIPNY